MRRSFYEQNLRLLSFQRNVFLALTALLTLSVVCLSIFTFWKNERVIIVPPTVEKSFWVDANSVSPTYLEQFGLFLGQNLLSKSPQSAQTQREILLRHTDPSFVGTLSKKLNEEAKQLIKQGASYVFYPIDVQTNIGSLEVLLTGDRIYYVSGKAVSKEREGYRLSFSNQGARLFLKEVTSMEGER